VIIAADHPSLAGHFPGNPIVPGVVLLDEVIAALAAFVDGAPVVTAMPNIKFVSPLLPDREFSIDFEQKKDDLVNFSMTAGDSVIVTGSMRYTL